MLDRAGFIAEAKGKLPGCLDGVTPDQAGLLHCEVAVLRVSLERAIADGREWHAERGFRLVQEWLERSAPELEIALEVSFLHDFAFGEHSPVFRSFVRSRVPAELHARLVDYHPFWGPLRDGGAA